jgi:hypothetical protein
VEKTRNANKKLVEGREFNIEIAFRMKTDTNKLLPIKWITSFVNSELNWIFKVGVALSQTIDVEEVDTIREYYKTLIKRDRLKIDEFKEINKKYSDKANGGQNINVNNL